METRPILKQGGARKGLIAVVATAISLVAAVMAVGFVAGANHTSLISTRPVVVQQQHAPDPIDWNAQIGAAQSDGPQSDLTRALPTVQAVPYNPDR